MENLLWVWRAACTKQGWSVSFSSSWVNAMSPACSIRPRLSVTWAANASPRFCRAASSAWVSEAWRSARAAVRSLMLWASCSLADTLFTWWWRTQTIKVQTPAKLTPTWCYLMTPLKDRFTDFPVCLKSTVRYTYEQWKMFCFLYLFLFILDMNLRSI